MKNSNTFYVRRERDCPKGPHWGIMHFTTRYVPGDERSRSNLGHGYPASNEPNLDYVAYTDKEDFVLAISEMEKRSGGPPKYRAFKVEPVVVTTKVQVEINN